MDNIMDSKPKYSSEDLVNTLLFITDLLERAPIEYLLLKDTALQAKQQHHVPLPKLDVGCLEIGVTKNHFTEDGSRMLKTLFDLYNVEYSWRPDIIMCSVNGVPIHIQILKRNYQFLKNPTRIFFNTTEMLVPNPFDKYYKARFIVR